MVATIANAAAAYANAGRIGSAGLAGGEGGDSFGSLLKQAAGSAVDALKTGEAASLQAVAGGKVDLTKVTEAVNNAEIALQAVIAAYNDISKMAI